MKTAMYNNILELCDLFNWFYVDPLTAWSICNWSVRIKVGPSWITPKFHHKFYCSGCLQEIFVICHMAGPSRCMTWRMHLDHHIS